ncbi:Hypothetical predicted protein [Pelobates cultripes]|uniref:Uncharacterized protein n=1 Tax=Pelobates cultripes TaxID=61616 RepID=A0AAD1SKR2_PELCU|nr:Hypothetical predicted protein [Pelobates cultripes]
MKGVWKKLCPQLFGTYVEGFIEPAEIVQQNTEAIVTLANKLDRDISTTDVNELLEAQELSNEDLSDMEEQKDVEEVEDVTAPETPCSGLGPIPEYTPVYWRGLLVHLLPSDYGPGKIGPL